MSEEYPVAERGIKSLQGFVVRRETTVPSMHLQIEF